MPIEFYGKNWMQQIYQLRDTEPTDNADNAITRRG